MRSLRQAELWAALVVFGLLTLLSIIGAFLGAEGAGAVFTSIPLAVFWAFFVILLVAGILTFPRLRRAPALLVVHVGFMLIVAGAFWSSETGNRLEAALVGKPKVHAGYMGLREGQASNAVMADPDLKDVAGRLPFSVYLKDFTTEYYPAKGPWQLVAEFPRPPGHTAGAGMPQDAYVRTKVEWELDKAVLIPHTSATVTVLHYLPSARPKFAEGAPSALRISTPAGVTKEISAEPGASITLEEPKVTVTIMKVFSNLHVIGSGDQMQIVDVPGPPKSPALQVKIEKPDGTTQERYVSPIMPMHGEKEDSLHLDYQAPEPVGAEQALDSLPAMEIEVSAGEKTVRTWLFASQATMRTEDERQFVFLSLGDLLSTPQGASQDTEGEPLESGLYLLEPPKMVKDWKATVSVLEEGQSVLNKVIEVNHPLHYGGYRFYQYSYRRGDPTFTELSVASDSGVRLIYLGFILVGGGAFWWMWLQPVWNSARKRRKVPNGDQ